jgi:hypothetical protein
MTVIDKIEKSLGGATAIQFFPTPDYNKEPPVIVLTFDKPHGGADGYNLLLDNYKDKNASLVIYCLTSMKLNSDHLDILWRQHHCLTILNLFCSFYILFRPTERKTPYNSVLPQLAVQWLNRHFAKPKTL